MKRLLYIIVAAVGVCVAACSRPEVHYSKVMDDAELLMQTRVDSAMQLLDGIEPSELTVDSLRAKYYYLRAIGHMRQNRSMIADSLIHFVHEYYRSRDMVRGARSGTARAWYKFWVGDMPGAMAMLDSMIALQDMPDSLMVQIVRVRALLGASEYEGEPLIPVAEKLMALETDTLRRLEAKYILVSAYEYSGNFDEALALIQELIDYSAKHKWGDKQFYFEVEKAQILAEMGKAAESDAVVDRIFARSAPDNGAADYLHFLYSMNALNAGNIPRASRELELADSLAIGMRGANDMYYRSFSNLLHTMIDFRQNGRLKLTHVNGIYDRQRERYNRMEASQWESERGALQQQSRALSLKAENEHKRVIIMIIGIIALVILAGAAWIIILRRQHERENEERIEALQKMIDEYRSVPPQVQPEASNLPALRRAMLQQLGIIKMVAETPTEQNREMLRKISSIDGETNGELVNWGNLFELIDNLYSGFYRKLRDRYGDRLSPKEEQIIVLMVAGFSTKEIGVITRQTTATIYVRKSSIRKKLGVPEKEDIVAFLRREFAN